jgi:hypothetical protein
MSLLHAFLIFFGPFLVVAPFALVAARSFAPPSRWRAPVLRLPSIRIEVAW